MESVSGIRIVDMPICLPTNMSLAIPESPISLRISERLSASATVHTGASSHDEILNTFRMTNAVPKPSQARLLRSIRTAHRVDLQVLDAEILRLYNAIIDISQQLANVSAERVRKENVASICTSILSPLRRLPPETLGEIFLYCLPSHGQPTPTEAPLSLVQVCSAWRRAALGFPLLWADLALKITPAMRQRATSHHVVDMMKLWLSRAQNCYLTLELEFQSSDYPNRQKEDESMTNAWISYLNRLHDLSLTVTSIHDIRTFATLSPGTVNALEVLYLDIKSLNETDTQIVTVFDNAPHLRKLSLKIGHRLIFHLRIPWHQLTHLTIFEAPLDQQELFGILRACEELVSGSFSAILGNNDAFLEYEPHVLENLVDFHITLEMGGHLPSFNVFEKLAFPSLSRLTLQGDRAYISDISLINFLQRTKNLQHLALTSICGERDDFLPILQSTPHLVSLQINIHSIDQLFDIFIEALTYESGQPHTYLPSLEKLDFYIGVLPPLNNRFDEDGFVAMLRSRQNRTVSPPPVAYLSVLLRGSKFGREFVDPDPFNHFERLQKARESGEVEVEVQTLWPRTRIWVQR